MARKPKPTARANQWTVGAPSNDHPIMSELARFHAGFATLEMTLNILMAFALDNRREVAEAILLRIRNIADRIEIIKAVAEASDHLTGKQKFAVGLACQQAIALNARRNVYAHGLYEHRGDKIRITPYAYSTRASQKEFLKLERVEKDVEAIAGVLVTTMMVTDLFPEKVLEEILASPEKPRRPHDPKGRRT